MGTATSVALGVLFYARADIKTALGVFAGLLGVTITTQVQSIVLTNRRIDVATRSGRMLEALETISWLPPLIEEITSHITRVERDYSATPAVELCQQVLQDCLDRVNDLQRGHFEPAYGDQRLFNALTSKAVKQIRATSAQEMDLAWWLSPRSEPYWELQREALGRKVTITRVFIYSKWNDDLDQLARKQSQAGIEVRTVHRGRLPPRLVTDMVIWDETCGYETRSNAAGEPVINFFTLAAQDVEKMRHDYEAIIISSTLYKHDPPSL